MQRYITPAVGLLFILCMLFPFAYTTDSENYSVFLVSGWWYFSQNLFSFSSILIFLAFFFINYQGHKNIQLVIFVMTFMLTLYFYCLPILALGEEFWSRIIELPVAYYICGLLMLVGVGLKVQRLVSV
ncbi:TPA: hypothetical protein U1B28_000191 [Streptococcus suis]|uniref:hypothetical protein n=1 Tax=Streptococcus suis TaxID=1307 RepID=UPI00209BB12F|nr:hypothetical protein [Streptococcus suis]MCO8175238.1 hypothetical protein [Streptococcus suis]MCO8208963.1 hypothetical protein [Streptococcus suis]HEM3488618.1 hypothetical protein [Streptococcus suis]HEM3507319.1 hypothetical protein [Streptococcus suis]